MADNIWTALKNMGAKGGEGFAEGLAESRTARRKAEILAEELKAKQEAASKLGDVISKIDKPGAKLAGGLLKEYVLTDLGQATKFIGMFNDKESDAVAMAKAFPGIIKALSGGDGGDLDSSIRDMKQEEVLGGDVSVPSKISGADYLTTKRTVDLGPVDYTQENIRGLEAKAEVQAQGSQRVKELEDIYKTDRLMPKMEYLVEVGAGAYKEVQDKMKEFGLPIKAGRGANAFIFGAAMNTLGAFEITSLRDSVGKMQLEVGTELMRTLGAFRNVSFAKELGSTLGDFSGNPYKDIENISTTFTKSLINDIAAEPNMQDKTASEKNKIRDRGEAMAFYQFSKQYVDLGILPSFHFGHLQPEDTAERLESFIEDHPKYKAARSKWPNIDKKDFNLKFFMKGANEGWL